MKLFLLDPPDDPQEQEYMREGVELKPSSNLEERYLLRKISRQQLATYDPWIGSSLQSWGV